MHGKAGGGGLCLQTVDGILLEVSFIAGGERLYRKGRWKFNPDGVLVDVCVLKVDRDLALLMGEGGLGVGFEDIGWDEETLAGGGTKRPADLQVDDEWLFIVVELAYRGDFNFKP